MQCPRGLAFAQRRTFVAARWGIRMRYSPFSELDASSVSVTDPEAMSWEDRLALEERQAQEAREAKQQQEDARRLAKHKKLVRSSWTAKEAGGGRGNGADYLYEMGASSLQNLNIDTGQNIAMLESHFTGSFLGAKSDIADGSLRRYEFRSFDHIVGDYYVAPAFLDKITMHIVKNYLVELGAFDKFTKVPLILGVWGEKGMGKSFQTELALKKLGVEAVVMSAGELEHEWAGTPGRLIRERYKKAGELSKVRGKFSVLMINDIDAGLGHFDNTQTTVNNQIVVGTLMNLCDHPTSVSVGLDWKENDVTRRIPIIVTGNDFSRMFAPLIRDGRMDKFYWQPSREDLVNILITMYEDDGLTIGDMEALLDRFPRQPLDFFGALRAGIYDAQIRHWIEHEVLDGESLTAEHANMALLSQRLVRKASLPTFESVKLRLEDLVREGERLEMEQQQVLNHKLSQEYLKPMKSKGPSMIGLKG
ncbi:hypothetical protein V8C86DRAFT_2582687 [Haematococcus lacustris]